MKYLIYIALILLSAVFLRAEGSRGTAGAQFLEFNVGSRSLGIGEAYTANTEDINGFYYNPATLATLKYPEASFFHQEHITDSRVENISAAIKIKNGYGAFGNTVFWVPPFEKIDIDGNNVGNVNFYNSATYFSYGTEISNIMAGANAKFIYEKIDTNTYMGAGVDLGLLKSFHMYTPFDAPNRNVYLGLSIQNLGTKISGHPLPRKVNIGAKFIPVSWLAIHTDANQYMIRKSDLYDFTYGFDESFQIKFGMEFNYLDLIFLRSGYRFNDSGSYTFGLGVNYAVRNLAFTIDASLEDTASFGYVYSINFNIKLIPKIVTVEDIAIANQYYKKGLRSYVADDIDSAIESFEKTKEFNPYHKNIDSKIDDLTELKRLKKTNEELEKQRNDF